MRFLATVVQRLELPEVDGEDFDQFAPRLGSDRAEVALEQLLGKRAAQDSRTRLGSLARAPAIFGEDFCLFRRARLRREQFGAFVIAPLRIGRIAGAVAIDGGAAEPGSRALSRSPWRRRLAAMKSS